MKEFSDKKGLSSDEKASFLRDIEAVRDRVMGNLGDRDVRYIRRLLRIQRSAEVTGRALFFLGFNPVAWGLGVLILAFAKILENMEIGHNVMHGQYDWTNDPDLEGNEYEWDNVCPKEQWRHAHNHMHHTYANIVGRDLDLGYGVIRMSSMQKWHPINLFQPFYTAIVALLFEWGVGFYGLLYRLNGTDRSFRDLLKRGDSEEADEFLAQTDNVWRKVGRQVLKDYILFPILTGPLFLLTLAGNAAANVLRNLWSFIIIFCGHFTRDVAMYPEAVLESETKADWYIRQIEASSNISGSFAFHVMTGNLSHQIEHHLFPDMPSLHYAEIAPEIRGICERYGIVYNTGSLSRQFFQVLTRIFRYSLPDRALKNANAEAVGS
jgi:linoleoyl-CoA desaturase